MELNEAIDELRQDVRQFNEEAVEPLKERLASLEERETAPEDQKVLDLEARLAEQTEKLGEMSETLRLVQASDRLVPSGFDTQAKTADPFKGFIFRDIDEVRHELLHGQTRAVNLTSIASAGKLTDETASAFLDYVVGDQSTLSVVEKRVMNSPTARLDRIGVTGRKLRAATEAQAPSDTNSVSFAARSLSVVTGIWAEDITLDFLEDNIAGGNAEGQIASTVSKKLGEDLNDLLWNGDTADSSGDSDFLGMNDGFEKLFVTDSGSNVTDYDMTSETTAVGVLNKLYSSMPSQYRTLGGQTIFCSPGLATAYMGELGGRATTLGDSTLVNGIAGLAYFGIPIVVDRHLDADKVYMTPRDNLVFGVHRDITQEMDWNPRKRQIEMTVTLRFDFQYKFGGIVARGHTIAAGLE